MAQPYLVASGITLTRSATVTVKAIRRKRGEVTYRCWKNTPPYEEVEYTVNIPESALCDAIIQICRAGWANQHLVSASIGWADAVVDSGGTPPPEETELCPYQWLESQTTWDWATLALSRSQAHEFFDPGGSETGSETEEVDRWTYNAYLAFRHYLPSNIAFSKTASLTVSVTGTFDVYARYDRKVAGELIGDFRQWWQDRDQYGPVSLYHDIYFVPTDSVTMSVEGSNYSASHSIDASDFASQEEFEEYFKYGFGEVRLQAPTYMLPEDATHGFVLETPEVLASGSITGSGLAGGGSSEKVLRHPDYPEVYPDLEMRFHPGTGAFAITGNGLGWSPEIWSLKGPFAASYTATGHNMDGNPRTGSMWTVEGHDTPDMDDYMTVALNSTGVFQSQGEWNMLFEEGDPPDPPIELYNGDYYGAGYGYYGERALYSVHGTIRASNDHVRNGGLGDLDSLGEPDFPSQYGQNPGNWFNDSRGDVTSPFSAFQWADALTFDVANSAVGANLANVSGWTVDPVDAAALSIEDGALKVVVTSDCRIEKHFDPASSINGARLIEFDHSSDDAEDIIGEINSHQWHIRPSAKTVDVLAPIGRNGSDEVQKFGTEATPGTAWAWGIGAVLDVAFDDLKAGKTYYFRTITGKRVTEANGGFTRLLITNDAFVGAEQGDNDASDDFSSGRSGILIVDGVYAAEGDTGMLDSVNWHTGGLVSVTVNDDAGWKQGSEVDSYYLVPGIYNGYGQINVDAELRTPLVTIPVCYNANPAFTIRKGLRGVLNVLLGSDDQILAQRSFTPEFRVNSGSWTAMAAQRTNALGWKSIALQQPYYENYLEYRVKVKDKNGDWIISQPVQTRNRNGSQVCLVGGLVTDGGKGLTMDTEPAIRIYRSYVLDNNVVVDHTDDGGATWLPETPNVVAEGGITPAVSAQWTTRHQTLAVIYVVDSKLIKKTSTDEGDTWGEAMTLCDGTHPAICEDPATGHMLLFYYSGGKLYVRRTDDNFGHYIKADGSRVAVDPAPDPADVAFEVAGDAADDVVAAIHTGLKDHQVMVVYQNTGGLLACVFSSANGMPPYA